MKFASFTYSKLVYSHNRDYTVKVNEQTVSIGTLDKRIRMPFAVGKDYLPYLFGSDWLFGSAELDPTRKDYSLHVMIKCEVDEPTFTECNVVIGVDRGMNFLAVAINQDDKALFCKGCFIKNKKTEFVRRRKKLQRKGTRSAKRKLKKLAGRENRFMTNINHQDANGIILFAKASVSKPCITLEYAGSINFRISVRLQKRYCRFCARLDY